MGFYVVSYLGRIGQADYLCASFENVLRTICIYWQKLRTLIFFYICYYMWLCTWDLELWLNHYCYNLLSTFVCILRLILRDVEVRGAQDCNVLRKFKFNNWFWICACTCTVDLRSYLLSIGNWQEFCVLGSVHNLRPQYHMFKVGPSLYCRVKRLYLHVIVTGRFKREFCLCLLYLSIAWFSRAGSRYALKTSTLCTVVVD